MTLPALGIDVSKRTFHATLLVDGKAKDKTCENSSKGFEDLLRWLVARHVERVHACMESTGPYGEDLAV